MIVATLAPQSDATVTVSLDGERGSKSIRAGVSIELPFANELRATLPGFGELTIRSDSAGARSDLPAARTAFERLWLPIKAATKCQTLDELESLQEQARAWRSEADALSGRASQSRVRGEGVEAAERDATLAGVEVKRCLDQFASLVAEAGEPDSAERVLERLELEPIDERTVQQEIDELEANMRERDRLRQALSAQVAGDEATLNSLATSVAEREAIKDAKQSRWGVPGKSRFRRRVSNSASWSGSCETFTIDWRRSGRNPRVKWAKRAPNWLQRNPLLRKHPQLSRTRLKLKAERRNWSRNSGANSRSNAVLLNPKISTRRSVGSPNSGGRSTPSRSPKTLIRPKTS